MARQKLAYFPGTGIACEGAVRTILLLSKVPFKEIRTLAVDAGSRTSVMLSRVILAERYGVTPQVFAHRANKDEMLALADAALIIGDPALHIDPENAGCACLDLGAEWFAHTGLPMVFAVWSARQELQESRYAEAFQASLGYSLVHMDEIVREQAPLRGVSEVLTREYLTHYIVFQLGERHYEGMRRYLELALALDK
jgi:chorismate dehydratase